MPPVASTADAPYVVDALGAPVEVSSPLHGAHQHRNIALAIAAAAELATHHGLPVTPRSISAGIRNTRWPARLEQVVTGDTEFILDVAHNPAGAWALRAGLHNPLADARPHTLIFSCLRDKPVAEIAQILFPLFDQVIFAPIHSLRATSMSDLLAAAKTTGTPAHSAESVIEAITLAREEGGLVVISGSVYLVGEARAFLLDSSDQGRVADPHAAPAQQLELKP
jgi:dihydrofolate synthase / folylpolyglutamate synthase